MGDVFDIDLAASKLYYPNITACAFASPCAVEIVNFGNQCIKLGFHGLLVGFHLGFQGLLVTSSGSGGIGSC
jgi:hypothetical protein